jgi:hypothetical protein
MDGYFGLSEMLIPSWKRPREDWIKFNFDVSSNELVDFTCCGDFFRDSNGLWLINHVRKSVSVATFMLRCEECIKD